MYQQDWILREIEMLCNFVARLFFKQDIPQVTEEFEAEKGNSKTYRKALNLLDQKNLKELMELMNATDFTHDKDMLIILISKINALDDKVFEENEVEREEVKALADKYFKEYFKGSGLV